MLNVPDIPEFNVEQMAKILNMRKNKGGPATTLFLGSRTSSLFRRPFLVDQLKGFSYRDFSNMTPVEQFRECYKILEDFKKEKLDRDIHFIIRQALREQHVEVADICVAELMKQGIFDCIITTNIGSELELAVQQSGMIEHRDFNVITPESDEIDNHYSFKLIKAKGDFSSENYALINRENYIEQYPTLKRHFKRSRSGNILIIGLDDEWDKHIIQNFFPFTGEDLWYVNEEKTIEASPLFSYLHEYKAKRLEGTIGRYELFFANLCWHILGSFPSIPADQITPDKLINKDKMLNARRTQHNLPDEMSRLTETVNKLLESQEAMKKDIKSLSEKIDMLLTHSTPNTGSLAKSSTDAASTSQGEHERPPRKAKQLEEN